MASHAPTLDYSKPSICHGKALRASNPTGPVEKGNFLDAILHINSNSCPVPTFNIRDALMQSQTSDQTQRMSHAQ
jgi:hypothetical protein